MKRVVIIGSAGTGVAEAIDRMNVNHHVQYTTLEQAPLKLKNNLGGLETLLKNRIEETRVEIKKVDRDILDEFKDGRQRRRERRKGKRI